MDTLEYCPICRCAVLKKDHTRQECARLAKISQEIRADVPREEQEITLERMRGLLKQLKATMKEHETTICFTCSDLLAQDSLQRCAEYRQMQEIFWKWGKRYDDTALIMALRKGGNEIHGLH